jgi:hypothetical protein
LEPRLAEARAVFFVDAAHFVFGALVGALWCFARLWIKAPRGRRRFNYARGGQGAAHGVERGDPEVSGYDLVHDLAPQSESLQTRAEDGAVCRTVTASEMAAWLIAQAARLDLRRYRKHPRGPKKVPPKRVHAPSTPGSLARLLIPRKKPRTAP